MQQRKAYFNSIGEIFGLAFDAPVEGHLRLRWREGEELFEYLCQQSNYAHDLMVNPEDLNAIGKSSPIVP